MSELIEKLQPRFKLFSYFENWIVDDMTTRQVNYINPVEFDSSTGYLTKIYKQIKRDFQLVPPLTLFSPSPEVLGGVWSIWRESQIAIGLVPRSHTEAIAAAVSKINVCPYCVDAHSGMLFASSDHEIVKAIRENNSEVISSKDKRDIVEWSFSNRLPENQLIFNTSFNKAEAPEIIGTAVVYHLINRMVTIFLNDSPLPVPSTWSKLKGVVIRIFGATIGKSTVSRRPVSGDSLVFVPKAELPDDLAWSLPNKNIATAFAGLTRIIENSVQGIIPDNVQQLVRKHVNAWQGEDMGLGRIWVEKILLNIKDDKALARICLLTALAPHQVDNNVINEFRDIYSNDKELIIVTTWASYLAARRIGSWLDTAS